MENLKIPAWCHDAVLTTRGITNKFTGEIYISKKGIGGINYKKLIRELGILKGAGKSGQLPMCCAEPEKVVEVVKVVKKTTPKKKVAAKKKMAAK